MRDNVPLLSRVVRLLRKQAFQPAWFGAVINPVFIIRRGLFRCIRGIAPDVRGHVLDLGCGSKPYENLFVNASSYIGCDVQVSGHDHGTSRIDCIYDGRRLPFADGTFDAVVSFETFEHIFNLPEVLAEIHRVTKPSGLLLISIPFAWDEHEAPYDFARYTSFGIEHIVRQHGYEIVKLQKTTTYVLAVGQMFIAYLAQHVLPKGVLRYPFQLLVLFPLTVLTFALNAILPRRYQYFCGIVALARKRG